MYDFLTTKVFEENKTSPTKVATIYGKDNNFTPTYLAKDKNGKYNQTYIKIKEIEVLMTKFSELCKKTV